MKLILIGMIIGIGKIIPGVSGAMLAISLGVYERALNSITNFFDKPKENLKFLFLLGLGIFLAIILGSKIIIYFLNKFNLMTMMFFIGLIISGVLEYNKNIKYTFKSCLLISTVVLTFVLLSFVNSNNAYVLSNNFNDLIVFFLGGIIEIFSSLVPGISGTALLMILGIYEHTLVLFSSVYDLNYVLKNIQLYISYGLGMGISFIVVTFGINYLFKYQRQIMENLIFGFAISSIILLFKMLDFAQFNLWEYFLSWIFLFLGVLLGNKGLEK